MAPARAEGPSVGIVVAPRAGHDATACVQALAAQARALDEIVVVCAGSPAGSVPRPARASARVRVLPAPAGATVTQRRALGALATTGDVVAFVEDDLTVDPGWLAALRAAYADPDVAAVCGPVHDGHGTVAHRPTNEIGRMLADGRLTGAFDVDPGHPVDVDVMPSANYSVRRTTLESVGGIDPRLPDAGRYADVDVAVRLRLTGARLVYVPGAAGARPAPPHRRRTLRELYLRRRSHATVLFARLGVGDSTARYFVARAVRDQRLRLRESVVLMAPYRDRADGSRRPWRRRLDAPMPMALAVAEIAGVLRGAVTGIGWRLSERHRNS